MPNERLSERNAAIAEMLKDGSKLKNFYRFIAQNPHINLHDACQIILERTNATICFSFAEWNAVGRRVTKGRKGIPYLDNLGYKQFVFDLNDTHGETRYQRQILPMKHLLVGLDELNGENVANSDVSDIRKIQTGVEKYIRDNDGIDDENKTKLIAEGVAYLLYCKTGFPKSGNAELTGLPYSLRENADLVKEIFSKAEALAVNIEDAYQEKQNEVVVIEDVEEDAVSDEPVFTVDEVEKSKTRTYSKDFPEWYVKYLDCQVEQPNAIVATRLGDFYEMYGNKAVEASKILDLTLTGRVVQGEEERIPMCGFPYHAAESYIDKLRKHTSVVVIEPDKEPILLQKHTEAEADIKTVPFPGLTEVDDEDFDDPFNDDEIDGDTEDYDEAEDYDDYEADSDVAEKAEQVKPKSKSIRSRKKKDESVKQLSIFDNLDDSDNLDNPDSPDKPLDQKEADGEKLIKEVLRGGSHVEEGKLRIYDNYMQDPTTDEFAKFLSHEYGTGGYSGPNMPSVSFDGKGMLIKNADRTLQFSLKWNNVAKRIADLIDDDDYLTDKEKERYLQIVHFRKERQDAKTDEEKIKVIANEIAEYGTEHAYSEIYNVYPHFLEESVEFFRKHKAEVYEELAKRKEVVSVGEVNDDSALSVSFELEYCPRWQAVIERREREIEKLHKTADKFVEQHAADFISQNVNDEYATYNIYRDELDEEEFYFIKDNRDEFVDYLKTKEYVDDATFTMDKISVTYDAKKLLEFASSTDEQRNVKTIVDKIVKEGTQNTSEGNWIIYFDEFGQQEQFVRKHLEDISVLLAKREEVAEVSIDDECIDTTYYLDYCVNIEDEADEISNTSLNDVGFDQSELGGAKTRFRNNVTAIKLVNKLYAENRRATDEERKVLAKFVGWGGLAQAFDAANSQWQKEYAELKELLSNEDYE
ncbi:MAG: hypothetical protein NC311_17280, partial [Muribaculaceae bacterium]|nr:hypothetical protein [Muribaculaceae bacterium]